MLNASHQLCHRQKRRALHLQHRLHLQHQDVVMVMVNMAHSASAWKMRDHVAEHQIAIGRKRMIIRCASHQHRHRPLQHLCMRRDAVLDIQRRRIHSVRITKRERNVKRREYVRGFRPMITMIAFLLNLHWRRCLQPRPRDLDVVLEIHHEHGHSA